MDLPYFTMMVVYHGLPELFMLAMILVTSSMAMENGPFRDD